MTSRFAMAHEPEEPALLSFYEALEAASRDMVSAARRGDWDGVARIEGDAGALIERLRRRLRAEPLDPEAAREKLRILRRIVLNDAEVRCLSQPWLRDLHALLTGSPSRGEQGGVGEPWSGRLH